MDFLHRTGFLGVQLVNSKDAFRFNFSAEEKQPNKVLSCVTKHRAIILSNKVVYDAEVYFTASAKCHRG